MWSWTAQKNYLPTIAVLWVRVLAPSLCRPSSSDALRPTHWTAIPARRPTMAHLSAFRHVKLKRLCSYLELSAPHALGHMEFLWAYVADCHFDGDISSLTDDDIELAAEWTGPKGVFISGAIKAGFIDRDETGTRIHDWEDWAPRMVKLRQQRRIDNRLQKKCAHSVRTTAHNGAQCAPEPNRTEPNRKSKTPLPPLVLPQALDTPQFRNAWSEWEKYRSESSWKLTPTSIKGQLKKLEKYGHDDAIASLEQSITNGWRGLFPPRRESGPSQRGPIPAAEAAQIRRAKSREREYGEDDTPIPTVDCSVRRDSGETPF